MQEQGLPQMVISDPVAIYYLVEKWIFPGERFHALYISLDGSGHHLLRRY